MQDFLQIVASNAIVVVVLAAGVTLLGRVWRNPACLHLLWMCVLLKLVTPPLLTVPVALPQGQASPAIAERAVSPPSLAVPRVEVSRRDVAAAPADKSGVSGDHSGTNRLLAEGQAPAAIGDVAPAVVLQDDGIPWLAILGWAWALGVVVSASDRTCRILSFRRLLHSSKPPSCDVISAAERIGKRLGLRRVPDIRMMPVCVSPLVWSLGGRARVLLPAALFARLDAAAREAILAHELAHVRRKDHWVRLLEVLITTLFWWHPVVWWAARQLQELEDQCCDTMVLGAAPQAAKSYATALLDTLDFLSDRSVAAPLGATAAKSSASLARRITMLKNSTPAMRLTIGRILVLAAVVAVPMTLAFGAKPPRKGDPPLTNDQKPDEKPAVERRVVNKSVKDFPEKTDLSTPESAAAAFHRAIMSPNPRRWLELSAWKFGAEDISQVKAEMERKMGNKDEVALMDRAYREAEIIEVLTYRDGLAEVISKLKFPKGVGRDPYSVRSFVRIDGEWKNMGEDRMPSVDAAGKRFELIKDNAWDGYLAILEGIKSGKPVTLPGGRPKRSAPIAPGEPLGISVEKADLMGRIEWAFMHGARNITARKSLEWGDIEKDQDGNRTIRYKYEATIWGKKVVIDNKIFTFDAKGNILDMKDVEGYPKKKIVKPPDVNTQAGMKELVEGFFQSNFHDITSRQTIEWGQVEKAPNGNSSIRYKYRATIWDKDVLIMNQVFTFDAKGEYVSYKNVEGFPQKQ